MMIPTLSTSFSARDKSLYDVIVMHFVCIDLSYNETAHGPVVLGDLRSALLCYSAQESL